MDLQVILVMALFGIAVLYVIRMVYLSVKPGKKGGACKTCNACDGLSAIQDVPPVKNEGKRPSLDG